MCELVGMPPMQLLRPKTNLSHFPLEVLGRERGHGGDRAPQCDMPSALAGHQYFASALPGLPIVLNRAHSTLHTSSKDAHLLDNFIQCEICGVDNARIIGLSKG